MTDDELKEKREDAFFSEITPSDGQWVCDIIDELLEMRRVCDQTHLHCYCCAQTPRRAQHCARRVL